MRTPASKPRSFIFALALLCIWAFAAQAQTKPSPGGTATPPVAVRLGIIAEEPSAATLADVLTAELSAKPGLQLLERNELDRAYREQALSAANKDYLKLGQVLGADGLLVLSPLADGTNHFLQARLVAVKPGVIIGSVRSPWPAAEIPPLASHIARHFAPLLPKLSVTAKDAIPISIVNFRSAMRSTEAQETEQQLTLLAVERLSRERELFVLERQRMELLTTEKELQGLNRSAFWSGSHLLEGVLDRDGYSKDTLTLNARLLPAKGGAPVLIDVSGSRTNLSEVLNRLAAKVKQALKLRSQDIPWDPAAEAEQYFQEARWAFRWGMLDEARSACESSWALGNTTKDVAEFRIRIYAAQGDPGHNDMFCASPMSPDYAPNVSRLEPAIHALELYQQGFHWFLLSESKADTNWYRLGLELLSSELLRQFNYFPESCAGHEDRLATLRQLSRGTVEMLQAHPGYTNLSPSLTVVRLGTSSLYELPTQDLRVPFDFPLVRYGGAYWCETPRDSLQIYRQLAESRYLHSHRLQFAFHTVIGWNLADKQRAPTLWRGFVTELCGSTNPLTRIEGYFLDFADATPAQHQERAQALFRLTVETAGPLQSAALAEGFVKDIERLIADPPRFFVGDTPWDITGAFRAFCKDFEAASDADVRRRRLEAMRTFLANQLSTHRPDVREFDQLFKFNLRFLIKGPNYSASEAMELLPPLLEFKHRLERLRTSANTAPKGTGALADQVNLGNALRSVEDLLAQLEPLVPSGWDYPSPTNLTTTLRPAQPTHARPILAAQVAPQIPRLLPLSTNTLKITRFWQWPTGLVAGFDMVPSAGQACFRERRVWIQVNYKSEDVYLRKAFLFGVAPGSLSPEIVELPLLTNTLRYSSTESQDVRDTENHFEVLGEHLFFSLQDRIKRYSLASHTWEDLKVPTAGRLTVLDGRLFATTDDSIVEVSPDGDSETIWASARRHPPMNILDSVETYRWPPIFHGATGSIATRVNEKLYALDERTQSWSEITSLPEQPLFAPTRPGEQRASAYGISTWGTNLVLIPADQTSAALKVPQPPSLCHSNYSLRQCNAEIPIWPGPNQRDRLNTRICLAGGDTWLYFSAHSTKNTPGSPPILRAWRNGHSLGGPPLMYLVGKGLGPLLAVPLEMDLRSAVISANLAHHLSYGAYGSGEQAVQSIPTPAGIVLINLSLGVWLVPWAELETTLDAANRERKAQQTARLSAIDGLWGKLFAKYHLDQKDHLSPVQKEAMIGDPIFLELNLDKIDRNGNGILDAEELPFFDANQNGHLEPEEQAGIDVVMSLLAQVLFDQYDLDHDGQLDRTEFQDLVEDTRDMKAGMWSPVNLEQFDLNHDGVLSSVELRGFLKRQLLLSLRPVLARSTDSFLKAVAIGAMGGGRAAGTGPMGAEHSAAAALNPASPTHKSPDQLLLEAVDAGKLADAKAALEHGAEVDVRDDRGCTPLIIAAKAGHLDLATLLVEKAADVNARSTSKTGSTVLCFATESDIPELLALLVNHGGDVNAQSRNLVTPLYAAASNQKKAAAEYLIAHGARLEERGFLNEAGQRYTPLMAAAISGDAEMTTLLLARGANHEATNSMGDTLLMILARMTKPEMVKLLIDNGAKVNAKGPRGHTALIYAAYNGRMESVKLLLAAGADPNLTASEDNDPGSPRYDAVWVAEQQLHQEIAALIKQAQAAKRPRPTSQ